MPSIRLIAVDLDGTLFDSDKRISERNLAALREAARRGVYVAVATGRIYLSAMHIADSIAKGQPYISSNGAVVGMSGAKDFLSVRMMEDEAALRAMEAARDSGCQLHLHTLDGRMLHLETSEKLLEYCGQAVTAGEDGTIHQLLPFDELCGQARGQTIKMVVQSLEKPRLDAFRKAVAGLSLTMASSWWDNEELMAPGADKGGGVAALAEKLQIPLESVMVLGDNQNDLSMFRVAGFPVAMGNATGEIKAASRAVTLDNDRSGVGYAVEKYVLECAQDERGGRPHDL